MILSKRKVVALLILMTCALAPQQLVHAQATAKDAPPPDPYAPLKDVVTLGCTLDKPSDPKSPSKSGDRFLTWQRDMCHKQIKDGKDNSAVIPMNFAPDAAIRVFGVTPLFGQKGAVALYGAILPKTKFATFDKPTGTTFCQKTVFVGTYNLYWPQDSTSAVTKPGFVNNQYEYAMTIEPLASGFVITDLHMVRVAATPYTGTTPPEGNCVAAGQ